MGAALLYVKKPGEVTMLTPRPHLGPEVFQVRAGYLLGYRKNVVFEGRSRYTSFMERTPQAVVFATAVLVPFIIETSRAAALLWSVADAARSRYYSSAIGIVISIAFVWHELANVERYVEAAGGNQLVLASVKFIIVAALLLEARLIAGLFRR